MIIREQSLNSILCFPISLMTRDIETRLALLLYQMSLKICHTTVLKMMAVFTLEDEQIVWKGKTCDIFPSEVNLCRHTVVNLFILTGKSSWKNRLSRRSNIMICSSKNLFVPFAHQTICSSEAICPFR